MEFHMLMSEDCIDVFFPGGNKDPHGLFCTTPLKLDGNDDDDDDGVDTKNDCHVADPSCPSGRVRATGSHDHAQKSSSCSPDDYNSWIDLDEVNNTEAKYTSWNDLDGVMQDTGGEETTPDYDSDAVANNNTGGGEQTTPDYDSDAVANNNTGGGEQTTPDYDSDGVVNNTTASQRIPCTPDSGERCQSPEQLSRKKVVRERTQPNRFAVEAAACKTNTDRGFRGVNRKKKRKVQRYSCEQMRMLHAAYQDLCKHPAAWKSSRSYRSENMEELCRQTGLNVCQINKWFYSRGRNHPDSDEDWDDEEIAVPAAARPLFVPPTGRGRGRYPAWILKELSRYLPDYVADPVSWNSDTHRRMQLSERTGLTQKQVRQYFANHKAKLQGFRR